MMKLHSINMQNFKGIKDNLVTLNGQSARIFGDNATGKTTIYDAFLWLLFDKDSSGASSFGIKTRLNGIEMSQVDHSVEGVIELDSELWTLKKIYHEKWTRKRGQANRAFEGHETIYQINGVPKSQKEYQAFIGEIMPEPVFRLVTSPYYFNALPWKQRRDMLIDTCGGVTDEEVLDSIKGEDMSTIRELLKKHSLDDIKKIKNVERKNINEELAAIPDRIDEATKAMPDVTGNLGSLSEQAQRLGKSIETLRMEKTSMISGGATQKLLQQIAEIDTKIGQARADHASLIPDVSAERDQIKLLDNQLNALVGCNVIKLREQEDILSADFDKTSTLWKEKYKEKFPGCSDVCPTCGQYWEEGKEAKEADFNSKKSESLEQYVKRGEDIKKELEEVRKKIELGIKLNKHNEELTKEIKASIDKHRDYINEKLNIPSFESTPEYVSLTQDKKNIEVGLDAAKKAGEVDTKPIDDNIKALQADLDSINKQISQIELAEAQQKRIDDLRSREKQLAIDFEASEQVLYWADIFERTRAEMLDQAISGKFDLVRWTLSNEQINGGINPTCICTVHGVPYPDLNQAAKIQAGLDIIKTISREKGVSAPVVIDMAESITQVPPMDCQVIELIVSEPDKKLRLELIG